jgi:hypothetical protein
MTEFATLLQLSDFHFSPNLTQEGRAWYKEPFLFAKAKPHDINKLRSLSRAIQKTKPIDVLLATGDLSTDGSPLSLANCLEFIGTTTEITRGERNTPVVTGLGVDASRRILLPGNHDRFDRSWVGFQTLGAAFERRMQTLTKNPYVVGYRRPGVDNSPDEPALLIFVFDSTPAGLFGFTWPWHNIARGRLEGGVNDRFLRKAREIAEKNKVSAIDGTILDVRYSNCVRVAALHHHPIDDNPNTLMENSKEFIDCCLQTGMHVVLFGHKHLEFWGTCFGKSEITGTRRHKMTLFCCPSASEYSSESGFFLFDFSKTSPPLTKGRSWLDYGFYKLGKNETSFQIGRLDRKNKFKRGKRGRIVFSHPLT